ncbi:Ig-like domain-containing protein [Gryllotalpicola daejeonensis]|uniref:Ig-like domain-containing protein n=1 Tax=Gryllotalpicola daejeonensis TaxID=993087 RepID=A0ABP7ZJU9_9MICO
MTEKTGGGILQALSRHRTLASVTALALVAGVPTAVAVLHKGFPVSDVKLDAADVWVTNASKLLGGRLNHQIGELDASVNATSDDLDVLQNGAAYFLTDASKGSVQKIDPAYVSLTDQITIPDDSWVGYGGNTLAILSPKGELWSIDASNQLAFDPTKTKPAAKLGADAAAVVDAKGEVFGVSAANNALYTVVHPGATVQKSKLPVDGDPQITAVGTTPVVLDKGGSRLRTPDKTLKLPAAGLRLQQPSASSGNVLVAASDHLFRIPLDGGDATSIAAGGTTPSAVSNADVSAPVQLKGCDYAAWAASGRYLYACEGAAPVSQQIDQPVSGDDLRFRVNRNVIALNNVQSGDAWIVSQNMKLVRNWEMLEPSKTQKKQSDKGEDEPVVIPYQQMIAKRTDTNHRPEPKDDSFGVRAGRTTVLPVLDNDQDPDGDVLTVENSVSVSPAAGKLDVIDGGRALQFTPAPGSSGASFRYTVTDGRTGGEASANVQVAVHAPSDNGAPKVNRTSSVDVEVGQTISYNVLQDWIDPDGDSIFLQSATATSQDDVSFTPDGDIQFTNTSNQVGTKTVQFTVSDGLLKTAGTLEVNVKAKGTLPQVAVPDFAQVTLGRQATVDPLKNDTSPSGDQLVLDDAASTDPGVTVHVNRDQGTLSVTGTTTGTYYLKYTLGAGDRKPVDGLIRIDVIDPVAKSAAPLAVNDVAYVHPGQTTSVTPLDNDVSPSGRVLAVQQVTGGADAGALNLQLLDNTLVKITSPGVLEKQVQLKYTVSDGLKSADGTITVVPVAPLVNYQPPVAVTDSVNVRAGDIATVNVLDNDYSPDDQPFTLDPVLKSTARAGGTAFVSGSTVRYQAPSKAGSYSATYSITDEHRQTVTGEVIFNVLPSGTDRAPEPQTVTGRVFAGSTVPITIPLNGIDPDGDSVFFDGITDKPTLGSVSGTNATGFVFRAADSAAGTEELHYQVEDTAKKTATGLIRIAVIPRPTSLQPPTAVNDKVEVRPGKTGSVQVLGNDSDPNGYPITLEKKLDQVDSELSEVKTDGSAVLFTAPKKEGVYSLHYTITNGHGGHASAFVQVTVSKTAKPRYPTAIDHYVAAEDAGKKTSVDVDALSGATNPSGAVADLTVQTTGANAKLGKVGKNGTVTVSAQGERTVIAYQVTDPATKLTGKAFIIIPPKNIKTTLAPNQNQNAVSRKTSDAPRIKPGLGQQVVAMNGTKTFSFGQILDVPSGRPATLSGAPSVDHGTVRGSGTSFTFTPPKDFRGQASISFNVDDGKEDGATSDRITRLTLPVTVGSKDQSDVPPTFTPPKVQIEPGEDARKVDLRAASYHPNQDILNKLQYVDLESSTVNGLTATLSGATLSVKAPVTQKPNTTAVFHFAVKSANFSIPGEVDVTVTSSTRPLAQQKNPPQTAELQRGNSTTLDNAVGDTYWINPFPDTPLAITDATVANSPTGVTVTHTANSITVEASSAASPGQVSIQYHVEDATKDPARTAQVIGQFNVTIHDKPSRMSAPSGATADDRTATMTISAPTDNGKPIDKYQFTAGSKKWTVDVNGTQITSARQWTLGGLSNGTSYSFTVQAHNVDGWSDPSPASATVTPYGTPAAPQNLSLIEQDNVAPTKYNLSWSRVTDIEGKSIHYEWSFDGGDWVSTTATSATSPKAQAGTHSFRVRAVNDAGKTSAISKSGTATLPAPQVSVTLSKGASAASADGCSTGNCSYYHLVIKNYVKGTYPIVLYCNGSVLSSSHTMKVGKNGSGTWDSQNDGGAFCGFDDTHAEVNKIDSNHMSFR